MKLQMEFEPADFREMIYTFFDRQNFELHNLDELCEQFKQVFPNGLKASVGVKPTMVTEEYETEEAELPQQAADEVPPTNVVRIKPATKRLSQDALLDPSDDNPDRAPSSEELRAEDPSAYDAVELDAVIQQSKELEKED
jgi:hypothetical protein